MRGSYPQDPELASAGAQALGKWVRSRWHDGVTDTTGSLRSADAYVNVGQPWV